MSKVNVTYQVYSGGRGLPNVTNLSDYAGIYGSPVQAVYANVDRGSIKYRVHTVNGSWLPYVVDRSDYAGIYGTNIDGIQMEVTGLSGYQAKYRVYVGGRWLPWVTGLEDYAGIYGQAIEAIQVEIVTGTSGGGGTNPPPIPGGRKVFIDPGHGGSDPGAVGNGLREKDVVLSISNKVANLLKAKGIDVEFSRTNDSYVKVEDRAYMANNWGASLFVSIHANSFSSSSAKGTECYTYPNTSTANKTLSSNVASSIATQLSIPNRGHKEQDFAVLRLTNMPAILVETAFISNSNDASLLKYRQDDFAKCIANEILKYFGATTDYTEVLKEASKTGLLEDCGVSFGLFDSRKHIQTLSFRPQIDLFGELSLTGNIGATDSIDLSVGAKKLAELINGKLEFNNVVVDFTTENLYATFSQIGISLQQTDNLKYDIKFIAPSTVEIIVEHKITVNGIDVFQRLIIVISNIDDPGAYAVLLPVVALASDPLTTPNYVIRNTLGLATLLICVTAIAMSGGSLAPAVTPSIASKFATLAAIFLGSE